MATSPLALNQLAALLLGCSLEDEGRISGFYELDILTYPRPVQVWITEFMVLQHYEIEPRDLALVKRVVTRWTAHLRRTPHVEMTLPLAVVRRLKDRLQRAANLKKGPKSPEEWTWYKISVDMRHDAETCVALDCGDVNLLECICAEWLAQEANGASAALREGYRELARNCAEALTKLARMKADAAALKADTPQRPADIPRDG